MNTFIIADTHLDHKDIILHCKRPWCVENPAYDSSQPFDFRKNNPLMVTNEALEAHNQALADNWNKMVGKKDRVIIIGDFAFANHAKWANYLNGRKVLILGNHDDMNKEILKNFEEVFDFGCVKSIGTGLRDAKCKMIRENVTFCHFAMRSWAGSWDGTASIHAHAHGRMPELDSLLSWDGGVDVWGWIPVPWEAMQRKLDIKRSLIQARQGGYERLDGLPKGLYSPDPAQRVLDTRAKNLDILRSIGIEIGPDSVAIPPEFTKIKEPHVKAEKMITAVVASSETTNRNGVQYTRESLSCLADGQTFFWDEVSGRLSVKLNAKIVNDHEEIVRMFRQRIAEVGTSAFSTSLPQQINQIQQFNPEVQNERINRTSI
jgi:calcineurin-like phosphoesterase family protein